MQRSGRRGDKSLCDAFREVRGAWKEGRAPAYRLWTRWPKRVLSATDLRDLLGQSIVEIRTGKLDPKLANSISYLGAGFLRAMELADLERRLADLENVMELGKAALSLGKEEVYEGFEE